MNQNHTVVVTFWQGGTPPPSQPYAIIPISTSTTAYGFYGCAVNLGTLNTITTVEVRNCDQNWTWNNWAQYQVGFKVIDASGVGVPNIQVSMYPDASPDNGNSVGLVGLLALNLYPHTKNEPLIVSTDGDGIAMITVTYAYYNIADQYLSLCKAGQLKVSNVAIFIPGSFTPYDLPVRSGSGYVNYTGTFFTGKSGEGLTQQTPSMGNFVANYVHASVIGTAIPPTQTQVLCGFHVKFI